MFDPSIFSVAPALEFPADLTTDDGTEDILKGMTVQEQAHLLRLLQLQIEAAKGITSDLTFLQDLLRYKIIPERMDEEGLQSMNIKRLGTLYLRGETMVSTKQAMGPSLQDWMREHDYEDLITEVINASTLAAWVREQMKVAASMPVDPEHPEQSEANLAKLVPTHLLNIHPRTVAVINKS